MKKLALAFALIIGTSGAALWLLAVAMDYEQCLSDHASQRFCIYERTGILIPPTKLETKQP